MGAFNQMVTGEYGSMRQTRFMSFVNSPQFSRRFANSLYFAMALLVIVCCATSIASVTDSKIVASFYNSGLPPIDLPPGIIYLHEYWRGFEAEKNGEMILELSPLAFGDRKDESSEWMLNVHDDLQSSKDSRALEGSSSYRADVQTPAHQVAGETSCPWKEHRDHLLDLRKAFWTQKVKRQREMQSTPFHEATVINRKFPFKLLLKFKKMEPMPLNLSTKLIFDNPDLCLVVNAFYAALSTKSTNTTKFFLSNVDDLSELSNIITGSHIGEIIKI